MKRSLLGAEKMLGNRNLIGGVVFFSCGAFIILWTLLHYEIGSLSWPGTGLFPLVLGVMLSLLGVGIVIMALLVVTDEEGVLKWRDVDLRACVMITLGIIAFGMSIRQLGLFPAILATTLCAKFADDRLSIRGAMALAAGLALVSYLVFVWWLETPMSAVRWPK